MKFYDNNYDKSRIQAEIMGILYMWDGDRKNENKMTIFVKMPSDYGGYC